MTQVNYSPICYQCHQDLVDQYIPCEKCDRVIYCSDKCLKIDPHPEVCKGVAEVALPLQEIFKQCVLAFFDQGQQDKWDTFFTDQKPNALDNRYIVTVHDHGLDQEIKIDSMASKFSPILRRRRQPAIEPKASELDHRLGFSSCNTMVVRYFHASSDTCETHVFKMHLLDPPQEK